MFMAGTSAAPAPVAVPRGRLILIRPDGSEGGSHPLHDGDNLIGRGQAPLFDADAYLSPRHAELSVGPDGVTVRDLQSLNGIFLKITSEEVLDSGDIFRIGQELLRFEVISPPQALEDGTEIMGTPNPGFWGRLSVIVGRDVDGSAFPLFGEAIVLGRERGDILFPEDGYVSGTHARIALARRARVPDRPRLVERHLPAPAARAHRPHRLVHADGPAAVPPRVSLRSGPSKGPAPPAMSSDEPSSSSLTRSISAARRSPGRRCSPAPSCAAILRGPRRLTQHDPWGARGGLHQPPTLSLLLLLDLDLVGAVAEPPFWPLKKARRADSPSAGST